jgi:hypothetical protein
MPQKSITLAKGIFAAPVRSGSPANAAGRGSKLTTSVVAIVFRAAYHPLRRRRMPRFYLNVRTHFDAPDEEGIDRESLEEAKASAIAGVRGIVAHSVIAGEAVNLSHGIEITDELGNVLHIVRFADSFDLIR